LIVGFDADIDKLIQLYIIGVFTSFTLSQAGMVRHWNRALAVADPARRSRIHRSRAVSGVGAVATAAVLIVVLYTKVTHGAWLAILAMISLFAMMKSIRRHYAHVSAELALDDGEALRLPSNTRAVVLVSQLHKPTMRALAQARAARPTSLVALTVNLDVEGSAQLREDWERACLDIPLVVLDSPYREIVRPVLEYLRGLHRAGPRDVVTVFIPEYVVGRWWEQLLHNQSALRLKARLLFEPGVLVTSVPYQLRSSARTAAAEDPTTVA
jgi:hypothetical protein